MNTPAARHPEQLVRRCLLPCQPFAVPPCLTPVSPPWSPTYPA